MIIPDKDGEKGIKRLILIPNRSINWALLLKFYLLTCMISFSIALSFGFIGYWFILPFSGMEMLLLGGGLYVACRKIYQQEVITVGKDFIKIEKGYQSVHESWSFAKHWVQITLESKGIISKKMYIRIGSHGNFVNVGSFLTNSEKESLVNELNGSIIPSGFLGRVEN